MEAAIPISILAIGLARVFRRRSSVLENVIVTGIGGVAGSAGAIFAGGCLGVPFLKGIAAARWCEGCAAVWMVAGRGDDCRADRFPVLH